PEIQAGERARANYERQYHDEFGSRMRVAGVFRLAAFSPKAAALVATLFANAPRLAITALKGTRLGTRSGQAAPVAEPSQIMELSAPDGVSTDKVGISRRR